MTTEGDALLKAGSRWSSMVSDAEVIVVKGPSFSVDLRCGDVPMGPRSEARSTGAVPDPDGEVLMGKRYIHRESGLMVLCTRAGKGGLTAGGVPMAVLDTRALPSSD